MNPWVLLLKPMPRRMFTNLDLNKMKKKFLRGQEQMHLSRGGATIFIVTADTSIPTVGKIEATTG